MQWFKLSVKLPRDPKWLKLRSHEAARRYIEMACVIAEQETDGIYIAAGKPPKWLRELLDVGLVEEHPEGYYLPAFLKNNDTHEQMEAGRKKRRDAASNAARMRWARQHASTTTMQEVEVERERTTSSRDTSPEATRLCTLLADLVEANGSKRPTITRRWLDEADRMLRLDNRPVRDAEELIRWSQDDAFWKANVMSMVKFRAQYDTLRLQRDRTNGGNGTGHDPAFDIPPPTPIGGSE